jgi:hypothetical protein
MADQEWGKDDRKRSSLMMQDFCVHYYEMEHGMEVLALNNLERCKHCTKHIWVAFDDHFGHCFDMWASYIKSTFLYPRFAGNLSSRQQ